MFKVSREDLARELALLATCAEKKTTIPVLSFVLVETLIGLAKFTATDLDTSISTELQIENLGDPKSFCLPLSRFHELVRLLDGDALTITPESNDWVTVECEGSRQKLPSLPAKNFPALPEIEGVTVDATGLPVAEMLAAVQLAMSREMNDKPEYWNAEFSLEDEVLSLTTTNGFILGHAECPGPAEKTFSLLLPKRSISIYRKFCEGAEKPIFTISENNFAVKTQGRSFTSRLAANKFPNWRGFVPEAKREIELPSGLSAALRRSCLSTDRLGYTRHSFGDKKLTITARGHEEGEAVETLSCPSVNGDGIEIGINARHLLEVLRETGDAVMGLVDHSTAYIVRPKEERSYELYYVLMPVGLDRI